MLCLMVVVAVSALIFLSSLAVGVNDAMIRNSVGMFTGHISGFSIPQSIKNESLKINGVNGVLKRVYVPGIISIGNKIETINLVGIDPDSEQRMTALHKKKTEGQFIRNGEPSIYLSAALCETLNTGLGDEIVFRTGLEEKTITIKVSGIYRTGIEALDRKIAFCPLDILPATVTGTWSAAVFLDDGVDPESIIKDYHKKYSSLEFKSWKELMPDLLQLIDLNYMSMNIVMFLVFAVVSLGIACAFTIFILKNMREYGIMKSMGVTPGEVGYLIMVEIFLLNITASFAGIIIGVLAVFMIGQSGIDLTSFTSHNRYFVVSGVILPRLTLYSFILPPLLAMVFSMISAIWPALLVSRKKAVQILRSH